MPRPKHLPEIDQNLIDNNQPDPVFQRNLFGEDTEIQPRSTGVFGPRAVPVVVRKAMGSRAFSMDFTSERPANDLNPWRSRGLRVLPPWRGEIPVYTGARFVSLNGIVCDMLNGQLVYGKLVDQQGEVAIPRLEAHWKRLRLTLLASPFGALRQWVAREIARERGDEYEEDPGLIARAEASEGDERACVAKVMQLRRAEPAQPGDGAEQLEAGVKLYREAEALYGVVQAWAETCAAAWLERANVAAAFPYLKVIDALAWVLGVADPEWWAGCEAFVRPIPKGAHRMVCEILCDRARYMALLMNHPRGMLPGLLGREGYRRR